REAAHAEERVAVRELDARARRPRSDRGRLEIEAALEERARLRGARHRVSLDRRAQVPAGRALALAGVVPMQRQRARAVAALARALGEPRLDRRCDAAMQRAP